MRVLIAAADEATTDTLAAALAPFAVQIACVHAGDEAWRALCADEDIIFAIVDWNMPGVSGLELCRKLRQEGPRSGVYVLLLLPHARDEAVVAGLEAGADDYCTMPPDPHELRVRVRVALRILSLQRRLSASAHDAHAHGADGHELTPICSYCKQVHTDDDHWLEVDDYLAQHSEIKFTHHICPRCYDAAVKELVD